MNDSQGPVGDFTAITGADTATADRYLNTAGWNLEVCFTHHFHSLLGLDLIFLIFNIL